MEEDLFPELASCTTDDLIGYYGEERIKPNNGDTIISDDGKKNNVKKKPISSKNTNSLAAIYKLDNSIFTESSLELLSVNNNSDYQCNMYYDFLQLDETSDADSNSRHLVTTQPFRLLKGVLNQHVIDILQTDNKSTELNKFLLFNTKFSQSGESIREKELMPETL
jgi:hypothetical protein